MARKNAFDEVTSTVVGEIREYGERAKVSKVVPSGFEDVSTRTARGRMMKMSPEQRQQLLGTIGIGKVMELVGSGKGG